MRVQSYRHRVKSLIERCGGRSAIAEICRQGNRVPSDEAVRVWEKRGLIPSTHFGPLDEWCRNKWGEEAPRDLFGTSHDTRWPLPASIVGALPKKIKAAAKT